VEILVQHDCLPVSYINYVRGDYEMSWINSSKSICNEGFLGIESQKKMMSDEKRRYQVYEYKDCNEFQFKSQGEG